MAILTVGHGAEYSTLASAVAASHSGDTIQVAAGTYTNDFAIVRDNITIEGVGGMANFVATVPPPNGKAILVTNGNDTIENMSFSGAKVADLNGAGIRFQTGNLTLINDYFHNNQEGLLGGIDSTSTLTIKNSEFADNGDGSGYTHNLYVGAIGTLTIDNSLFTDAIVGHEIKSRAHNTIIENCRIIDGPSSTASYSVDLPDGGNAIIKNNVIEQGPHSENEAIIHYGNPAYASSSLEITDNTVVNDLHVGGARLLVNQTSVTASITDNQIYGLTANQIATGPATEFGNIFLTTEPHLDLTPPFQTNGAGQTNTLPPNVLADLAQLPAGAPQPDLSLLTVATATSVGQSLQAHGTEMLIGTAAGETLTGGAGFQHPRRRAGQRAPDRRLRHQRVPRRERQRPARGRHGHQLFQGGHRHGYVQPDLWQCRKFDDLWLRSDARSYRHRRARARRARRGRRTLNGGGSRHVRHRRFGGRRRHPSRHA